MPTTIILIALGNFSMSSLLINGGYGSTTSNHWTKKMNICSIMKRELGISIPWSDQIAPRGSCLEKKQKNLSTADGSIP